MNVFQICAVLLTLAALFGFLNYKFLKLPTTIGIMLWSLVFSVGLVIVGHFFPAVVEPARQVIENDIDFSGALLEVMLGYLLFAGALHVNLHALKKQRRVIGILATVGVVISTLMVGTATYYILAAFGIETQYLHCLLFGALISPTDPVAVMGIMKKVGAPKSLETKICGESLFNDGVGVVVFLMLLSIARGQSELTVSAVSHLFAVEVIGGILLGLALGYIGYWMLKQVDQYQVEVLITLALVTGGYVLAQLLHTSGPLAIVVTGLMLGNQGREQAMSDSTWNHLDTFWELVDEILNAVLFLLIGLELLILALNGKYLMIGVLMIPVVLLVRFIAVGIPVSILKRWREFSPRATRILTWGGLRGGISVALALALPTANNNGEPLGLDRDLFLSMTYVIVIFSIAVQGLTLKHLIVPEAEEAAS